MRRDALLVIIPPPKKQQAPKQKPAEKSEPPSSIPSWRRHPLTRLRWFRRHIRAQRWNYDHQETSLAWSLDQPSPGLPERPSFFESPLAHLHYKQLTDLLSMPRQRSIREMIALKGLEVEELYNRSRPSRPRCCRRAGPSYSLVADPASLVGDENLKLSEAIERAMAHICWAFGWLSDRQAYRSYDWIVKNLLWKKVQWIRRTYVWWAHGNMAWTIECYAMPPVPCSVLALSSEGGIVEEVDKQLGPVVEELEKAQKVIVNAIARKGTGRASCRGFGAAVRFDVQN
ncbi:uncharacterized protein PG998_001667 [Apiospora kogelbergensis]|uniref:uncharacterized protein n=1 Tax=Apiospora kogelbergensis TaxID=1337665 RepID=UPI003131B55D